MTPARFHCEAPATADATRRALRQLSPHAESFFQTALWLETWLDHLPPEADVLACRFDDRGEPGALALLGRHRARLRGRLPLPFRSASLMETGLAGYDRLTVEFNAPLLKNQEILAPFLDALLDATRRERELIIAHCLPALAGALDDASRRHGRSLTLFRKTVGWRCTLGAAENGPYDQRLSRNTRQAISRTRRQLEAEGPVELVAAQGPDEALAFFAGLRGLHQRTWRARGQAGAFADPRIVAFHESLIARGVPDAVHLLRLDVAGTPLGYFYNFQHRGRIYQYQVGFDYRDDGKLNLGLFAHAFAADHYSRAGAQAYDLLGGDAQYKRQLGTDSYELLSCAVSGAPPYGWL